MNLVENTFDTERLALREWRQEDLADFYQYASVEGVGEMAGWTAHKSIEETQTILDQFIEAKNVWAVVLKSTGKVIGSAEIFWSSIKLNKGTINVEYKDTRELGFVIAKDYWGQGFAGEICNALIPFCFDSLDTKAIICGHILGNNQSGRVIDKLGFKFFDNEKFENADTATETVCAMYYLTKKNWAERCLMQKNNIKS